MVNFGALGKLDTTARPSIISLSLAAGLWIHFTGVSGSERASSFLETVSGTAWGMMGSGEDVDNGGL